jgi:hypothetical protein
LEKLCPLSIQGEETDEDGFIVIPMAGMLQEKCSKSIADTIASGLGRLP